MVVDIVLFLYYYFCIIVCFKNWYAVYVNIINLYKVLLVLVLLLYIIIIIIIIHYYFYYYCYYYMLLLLLFQLLLLFFHAYLQRRSPSVYHQPGFASWTKMEPSYQREQRERKAIELSSCLWTFLNIFA